MDLKQNQNRNPDEQEQRACIKAIKNEELEKLSAFVETFGVDAPVKNGTCLHHALFANHIRLVKWLLTHNANPDALYESINTPLLIAIDLNHWDMAELLIQFGADVNLKDGYHNTPLSKAIFHYRGNLGFIKLLLAKGADPHLDLLNGYTAIDLAKQKSLTEVLELIQSNHS